MSTGSLCGCGPVVPFGETFVELSGRTFRDEGLIKNQIAFMRGNVVKLVTELLHDVPESQKLKTATGLAKLIRYEYSEVTVPDMERWLLSFEGRIFALWLSVRRSGVSYVKAVEVACQAVDESGMSWLDNVEYGIDVASGSASHASFSDISGFRHLAKPVSPSLESKYDSHERNIVKLQLEPYGKSMDEVLELTPYQMSALCKSENVSSEEAGADSRVSEQNDERGYRKGKNTERQMREQWWIPYENLAKRLCGKLEDEKEENGIQRVRGSGAGQERVGWWRNASIPNSWLSNKARRNRLSSRSAFEGGPNGSTRFVGINRSRWYRLRLISGCEARCEFDYCRGQGNPGLDDVQPGGSHIPVCQVLNGGKPKAERSRVHEYRGPDGRRSDLRRVEQHHLRGLSQGRSLASSVFVSGALRACSGNT